MKANELMIGDWVYGIDGKGGKHSCRINTIDIYPQNRTPRVVTSGGYGYQEENLEPIPLTAEILAKNGFERTELRLNAIRYTFSDDEYYAIAIDEFTDSLWRIEYTNCEMNFPLVRIMVCYVHEFQHALKLCGIDKEIEL